MRYFLYTFFLSGIISLVNLEFLIAQPVSQFIVVDQFGYLPGSDKIAVIRNPQTGYDAEESFTPGITYALVNAITQEQVFSADIIEWNNGAEDASSGDCAWWFDFSALTEQGEYYILDITNNVRSYNFWISEGIYNEILKQAVRTFFYQRVGHEKAEQYAGDGWADAASHTGPLQDKNCRIFNDPDNPSTEKDLHGGWYDAGDYNKYTSWTASYVVEMMKAYLENPDAWADDYNIPESGNGIPDLLDEARWGIDHLLRLQLNDGGVLCIVSLDHASPPSNATGQSLYGPVTTSASLNTASAFALSAKVFYNIGDTEYADTLLQRALKAWNWADANPAVLFRNNDSNYGSAGIGAGQQEEDDYGRFISKMEAACYLYEMTGNTEFRDFFDNNYSDVHLMNWNFAYPFETVAQEVLLTYTTIEEATASVVDAIRSTYKNAMNNGSENFPAYFGEKDPYLAHIKDYVWGSNSIKSGKANMFRNIITFNVDDTRETQAKAAAENYLHYIHGVNPFSRVYLSNMYQFGGDNCVNEFYHTWFTNGSPLWDRFGVSTYGPAPGFLTGGANPGYDWDGCCPEGCGSENNNAVCFSTSIYPPKDQPKQKSYKDFNTSWPLNSWSVTENSCGYQVNYIRLLSKYVNLNYDCSGELNGTADYDICGNCSGGNTGIEPETDPDNCATPVTELHNTESPYFTIFPNPANKVFTIETDYQFTYSLKVIDVLGREWLSSENLGNAQIEIDTLAIGNYLIMVSAGENQLIRKLLVH